MHFERIAGANVCRFKSFEHELTRGSIGVCGNNGSGKSTLLNLLYGTLSNDFSRLHKKKEECVRDTADEDEPSWVEATVVHNDHRMVIRRNFRPKTNSEVWIDGGKKITDANKAQAEIWEKLGIDRRLLDLFVFKQQSEIYDFLSVTPAVRAKSFAILCKTDHCETLWEELGDFMTKDAEAATLATDDADDGRREEADAKNELTRIDKEIEEARELLLNDESKASALQLLKFADERKRVLADIDEARATEEKLRLRRTNALDAKKTAASAVEEAQAEYDGIQTVPREKYTEAKEALAVIKSSKALVLEKKRLEAEAERLADDRRATKPPKKPKDFLDDLDEAKERVAKWRREMVEAQELLDNFEDTGLVKCPTCKTPVRNLDDILDKARQTIIEHDKVLGPLAARIAVTTVYLKAKNDYDRWNDTQSSAEAANEKSLKALGKVSPAEGDEDKLKDLVAKYDAAEKTRSRRAEDLEHAKEELATASAASAAAKARLEAHQGILAKLEAQLAELPIEDGDIARAKRRLKEHEEATETIAGLRGERKTAAAALVKAQETIAKLKAKFKRAKRVREMLRVAAAARDVLHRDSLPRRVAQLNLARIQGRINKGLARFGSPFWAETAEDLSFTIHKPGSPPQPADWLSTGQRVVLAMAFWPAVASLWSADLGMLALDEPSANLDAENRRYLAEAINALSAAVRGNKQLIVVTHDVDMRSCFDQVIVLGEQA